MMGKINTIPIIRIDKKTGEIKKYSCQWEAAKEGFSTVKIGHSCRHPSWTHRGYFWSYEKDFNEKTFEERLFLNKKPRRYKKYKNEDIKEKICCHCKDVKPIDSFHKSPKGMAGRSSYCKKCQHTKMNNRKKIDIFYRLKSNLRKRLNHALKVKKWNKNSHFNEYIGCSQEELKRHLESQFKTDMSWENYGKWEIDHIIPLSSVKNEKELYKLCHYTNLQPLWKIDNIKKGGYSNQVTIV